MKILLWGRLGLCVAGGLGTLGLGMNGRAGKDGKWGSLGGCFRMGWASLGFGLAAMVLVRFCCWEWI